MNELPVILSYFAQSNDEKHLAMLDEEADAIQEIWEPLDSAGVVQFFQRRSRMSTPEKIGKDIKEFGSRIVLFHFSGHADSDVLLMNDGGGAPDGIAGLLEAYAKKLKLVILNGCSTRGQVATFFRRGVPVVVATRCAVKDRQATRFAGVFHQTLANRQPIQDAYRDAVLALKSEQKFKPFLPAALSEQATDTRGGMLDLENTAEPPWGLFPQDRGWDVIGDKNWLAIQYRFKTGPIINTEKAYICERGKTAYANTFRTYFNPPQALRSPIQQYLLVGDKTESPLGLIRKFFYDCVVDPLHRQNFKNGLYYYSFTDFPPEIEYVELNSSHVTATEIVRSLVSLVKNEQINTLLDQRTADDLLNDFFHQNAFKIRQFVFIAFWIPASSRTEHTKKAIRDAVQLLNTWAGRQPEGVTFLFFWAFEQERSLMDSLLLRNPVKRLLAEFGPLWQEPGPVSLRVINQDNKFLDVPQRDDILNWINNHYRKATSADVPDELLQDFYSLKNVETLENKFLDLILKANLQAT